MARQRGTKKTTCCYRIRTHQKECMHRGSWTEGDDSLYFSPASPVCSLFTCPSPIHVFSPILFFICIISVSCLFNVCLSLCLFSLSLHLCHISGLVKSTLFLPFTRGSYKFVYKIVIREYVAYLCIMFHLPPLSYHHVSAFLSSLSYFCSSV